MIGIRLADHSFFPIVDERSPAHKRVVLTTIREAQPSAELALYRSDAASRNAQHLSRNEAQAADYLGSLFFDELPAGKAGEVDLDLKLKLDTEGTLHAVAVDRGTGNMQSRSFPLRRAHFGGVDPYAVPEALHDPQLYAQRREQAETERRRSQRRAWVAALGLLLLVAVVAAVVWWVLLPRLRAGSQAAEAEVSTTGAGVSTAAAEVSTPAGVSTTAAEAASASVPAGSASLLPQTAQATTAAQVPDGAAPGVQTADAANAESAPARARDGAITPDASLEAIAPNAAITPDASLDAIAPNAAIAPDASLDAIAPNAAIAPDASLEAVARDQLAADELPAAAATLFGGYAYHIIWGDTLWDISEAVYGTPWLYPDIARENRIRNPDLIYAEDNIFLPQRATPMPAGPPRR